MRVVRPTIMTRLKRDRPANRLMKVPNFGTLFVAASLAFGVGLGLLVAVVFGMNGEPVYAVPLLVGGVGAALSGLAMSGETVREVSR